MNTINEKTAVYKLSTHGDDSSYKVQVVVTRPEKTSNNNKEISLEKIASQGNKKKTFEKVPNNFVKNGNRMTPNFVLKKSFGLSVLKILEQL